MSNTEHVHIDCPECGGTGRIKVSESGLCDIHDCNQEAVYKYHNPHSGAKGVYCADHLKSRRPDLPISVWLENGFAKPLEANP